MDTARHSWKPPHDSRRHCPSIRLSLKWPRKCSQRSNAKSMQSTPRSSDSATSTSPPLRLALIRRWSSAREHGEHFKRIAPDGARWSTLFARFPNARAATRVTHTSCGESPKTAEHSHLPRVSAPRSSIVLLPAPRRFDRIGSRHSAAARLSTTGSRACTTASSCARKVAEIRQMTRVAHCRVSRAPGLASLAL